MVAHYFALPCCTAFWERTMPGIDAHLRCETATFWVAGSLDRYGRKGRRWRGGTAAGRPEIQLPDGFPGVPRVRAAAPPGGVFVQRRKGLTSRSKARAGRPRAVRLWRAVLAAPVLGRLEHRHRPGRDQRGAAAAPAYAARQVPLVARRAVVQRLGGETDRASGSSAARGPGGHRDRPARSPATAGSPGPPGASAPSNRRRTRKAPGLARCVADQEAGRLLVSLRRMLLADAVGELKARRRLNPPSAGVALAVVRPARQPVP